MVKKILTFAASNSQDSINKKFAYYTVNQIDNVETTMLDLNDFEMPIYSIDREVKDGIPSLAKKFKDYIVETDAIIISFAEHNGAYTAAYKNIYDWVSRIKKEVWEQKPMFLLATSPGGRGAKGVLEIANNTYRHSNKSEIAIFSLPSFHQNFDQDKGILDIALRKEFQIQLNIFERAIKQ